MTARDLTAADAALLQLLVERHPFKPYRNHRFVSRARQAAVLIAEVERVRQTPNAFTLVAGEGDRAVIATARPLSWDSAFFGLSMGKIEHLLRGAACDRACVKKIFESVLRKFREIGVRHITLKVDVADHDLVGLAEDAGFRLMDAIVTYISHPRRPPPRPVRQVGFVRPFRSDDTEEVLEVTREAYQGYRGRFQLDPHLPPERSHAFYLEWARKCCSGEMADHILVAEDKNGRLMGWTSVKRAEPASSVGGATISVGSLGACRLDSPGAYGGLICAAAVENHAAGVLTEAMTQNSNFAMVRVLEAVGAQYARAEYTFHAWLDE